MQATIITAEGISNGIITAPGPDPVKTATWLPLFPGFYESELYNSGREEEEYNSFIESLLPKLPRYLYSAVADKIEFDFTGYCKAAAREFCDIIEGMLSQALDAPVTIEYEAIRSPREYNFTTDSVNCTISYDRKKAFEYMTKDKDFFSRYFKARYTSRDGFCSFYSPKLEYWMDPDNWGQHETGAVLEAILTHAAEDKGEGSALLQCMYQFTDTNIGSYLSLPPAVMDYLQSDAVESIAALVEKQHAECAAYEKIMTGKLSHNTLQKIVRDARELAEVQARETLTEALEEL